MNTERCSVNDCDEPHFVRSLCRGHYWRQQRGINLEIPLSVDLRGGRRRNRKYVGQPCSVPGCDRAAEIRDMCYLHYNRKKDGKVPPERPVRKRNKVRQPCSFPGCGVISRSRGLCRGHYARWWHGLEVERPLLSVGIPRRCRICGKTFATVNALYCSRTCADEAWARQQSLLRSTEINFYATRAGDAAQAEAAQLVAKGFKQAKLTQGGTKPGLFTIREQAGLWRLRWYNKLHGPALVHSLNLEYSAARGERWMFVANALRENPFASYKDIAQQVGITRERVRQLATRLGYGRRRGRVGKCEGCDRQAPMNLKGRFFCEGHRQQFLHHGRLFNLRKDRPEQPEFCTVAGCDGRTSSHGMCKRHYDRWRYNNVSGVKERHRETVNRYYERSARGEVANPLPRCFDCDRALRPYMVRTVEIGGDQEKLCPACLSRRTGQSSAPAVVVADDLSVAALFEEINAATKDAHEDYRDDLRQELYVEALSGTLRPGAVAERAKKLRRQQMVAASDRLWSFVSLDDPIGGTDDVTYGSSLAGGAEWPTP